VKKDCEKIESRAPQIMLVKSSQVFGLRSLRLSSAGLLSIIFPRFIIWNLLAGGATREATTRIRNPLPKGLGEFSIQEKGIFDTRYHYISSYILMLSLCITCIIILYLIYHVPRRHMIYRLYHRFSFVMLYHVISCRVCDDTWT